MPEAAFLDSYGAIGAVRDGLGRYEDRFFSTVFLGSGLLFLAMMFVSMSVAAGLVATNAGVTDPAAQGEMVDLGKMVVLPSTKTYAVRMAAVFMMSLATIWLRTGLMPRWLVGLSYFAARRRASHKRAQHVGNDDVSRVGAGG